MRHGRRRCYRCLSCGGTFSRGINAAYYPFRCSARTFDRVAHLSVEGVSRAAIARIENAVWNTVDRWRSKAADFAQRFNDARTRDIDPIELQADEIRTCAPAKARPTLIFISMEVCSRLRVSTVVGWRSYRNTHALFSDTLARDIIICISSIAADSLNFYAHIVCRLVGPNRIYE